MSQLDRKPGKSPAKFRLDKQDGKIAGVCAGLANYFGFDITIVRVVFVLGALLGFGSFVLIYLAIWLLAN
ncbi:PspC domain-containing protein [Aurantiacibacter spongiae]|uniref:PspC domain-containing protein n=1 Tax=Aurantiacibacter spongiae TaxID=2488860 RepID=A0A3N5CZF4_9SPHN|nr:PspC domain-containing protein [Aurantiacibacter spongiae]RPF72099.1 PspC domain-containing protein [Aurantiacibacter spongiae]